MQTDTTDPTTERWGEFKEEIRSGDQKVRTYETGGKLAYSCGKSTTIKSINMSSFVIVAQVICKC